MSEFDPTQTALIIKVTGDGAAEMMTLPHNKPYVVCNTRASNQPGVVIDRDSRQPTPGEDFMPSQMHLRFDNPPKDLSQGWLFGIGNPATNTTCDILFGDRVKVRENNRRLSSRHFRIYHDFQTGRVLVRNISTHGTECSGKLLLSDGGCEMPVGKDLTLVIDGLIFRLSYPNIPKSQQLQHKENWLSFVDKCKVALPSISQLCVASVASTKPISDRATPREGVFNNYIIDEVIAQRRSTIVRKAHDTKTGGLYAIKIFDSSKLVENLPFKEIETLKSLNHGHIIQFHDFMANQDGCALVMEYAQCNLRQKMIGNDICWPDVKTITKQILTATAYLHENDIIHCNIEPENVLVTRWNRPFLTVKLSGFGMAANICGFFDCGTFRYRAPERSSGYFENPADIWAIGAMALEMLKGFQRAPPLSENEQGADTWPLDVEKWATEAFNASKNQFLGLVSQMLRQDPSLRPSAKECKDHLALERYDGDEMLCLLDKQAKALVSRIEARAVVVSQDVPAPDASRVSPQLTNQQPEIQLNEQTLPPDAGVHAPIIPADLLDIPPTPLGPANEFSEEIFPSIEANAADDSNEDIEPPTELQADNWTIDDILEFAEDLLPPELSYPLDLGLTPLSQVQSDHQNLETAAGIENESQDLDSLFLSSSSNAESLRDTDIHGNSDITESPGNAGDTDSSDLDSKASDASEGGYNSSEISTSLQGGRGPPSRKRTPDESFPLKNDDSRATKRRQV